MLAGWQPASSAFWQDGWQREVLAGSVLDDTTSMMDLALMLGALCAAALAGRFSPKWRLPWRSVVAALVGGLAIGYPPDKQEKATQTVLEQAELLSADWAVA